MKRILPIFKGVLVISASISIFFFQLRITAILAKIYLSMLRPFGKIKIKTPSITANILLRYCTILILFLVIIAIQTPRLLH